MRETLIHSTENNNLYIYDAENMISMLIHPDLSKAHENLITKESYYQEKYHYLKKHGFFEKPKRCNLETEIDESMIKENIIQINQLVFEVTDHCNLKCSYCSLGTMYDGFGKNIKQNLNIDHAFKLLKYVFSKKYANQICQLVFWGRTVIKHKFN